MLTRTGGQHQGLSRSSIVIGLGVILLAFVTFVATRPTTVAATPGAGSRIKSPVEGSAWNNNQSIASSPVSCGFSDPNGPFIFAPGLEGTIQPSNHVSLPSGSTDYIFAGSDAGGNPLTDINWKQNLGVVASYSGNLSVSIGRGNSAAGGFNSESTTNDAIAELGITGYSLVTKFGASTTSNGTKLSITYSSKGKRLVIVVFGGEGVGLVEESGPSMSTLLNDTYSECGSDVIASTAIFGAFLDAGTYTSRFHSTTYPTNSGTAAGAVAYIFAKTVTGAVPGHERG